MTIDEIKKIISEWDEDPGFSEIYDALIKCLNFIYNFARANGFSNHDRTKNLLLDILNYQEN